MYKTNTINLILLGKNVVASLKTNRTEYPSIFHVQCEILIRNDGRVKRCSSCSHHRKSLMAMATRKQKDDDKTNPSSHTAYVTLRTPEKISRLHRLQQERKSALMCINRLKQKIADIIDRDGITVDNELHEDLKVITAEHTKEIEASNPHDGFKRLFWEQQQKAASFKNSKSMRWHPLFIKWCIYLRHLSGSAYDMLRKSNCVKLPSQKTLRDYTYYTSTNIGFSDAVDEQLLRMADMSKEMNKYVGLVFDEVHIRADLVFDKHEGSLLGFVNLGEVNNHLMRFEGEVVGEEEELKQLANSMVVFMVRALFYDFNFPYVQFACNTLSGDILMEPLWETVFRLERMGLAVLTLTCDGASSNRRLWKLHSSDKCNELEHKVPNVFAPGRFLYFFCDPPHLLKTTRNSWYNKHRHLWVRIAT